MIKRKLLTAIDTDMRNVEKVFVGDSKFKTFLLDWGAEKTISDRRGEILH